MTRDLFSLTRDLFSLLFAFFIRRFTLLKGDPRPILPAFFATRDLFSLPFSRPATYSPCLNATFETFRGSESVIRDLFSLRPATYSPCLLP
jgi:hypothetical protein